MAEQSVQPRDTNINPWLEVADLDKVAETVITFSKTQAHTTLTPSRIRLTLQTDKVHQLHSARANLPSEWKRFQ